MHNNYTEIQILNTKAIIDHFNEIRNGGKKELNKNDLKEEINEYLIRLNLGGHNCPKYCII